MTRLASLVRADLRSNFGVSIIRHRLFVEKKDRWLVPFIAVSLLGVLPAIYGLCLMMRSIYLALEPIGQQRALLVLGVMTGQLFVLVFGLYYIVSAFYFSRDLEFLVALPLKPYEVLASKFTVVLVNEYLSALLFVVPIVGVYGWMAGGGIGFWTNAALVYLFLPVIPLAIAALLVVALMRFVNISRKKDALIVAGSILLLLLVMGLQYFLGASQHGKPDAQALTRFMTSPDSLMNLVGARFPPSIWASKAMAGGFTAAGLFNLVLFVGTSASFLAVLLVAAERMFYRGVVGLGEVSGRKRTLTRAQMSERVSSGQHPVRAIFLREWRLMNRTPIFLLNGTLVVVIVPAMFALMARSGSGEIRSLLNAMMSSAPLVTVLAVALFMVVCGSLNGTASSTFSREGAQFWISRVIPVAPRDQVAAKFLHSYLVSLLGTLTASVVAAWVMRVPVAPLGLAGGLALVAGVLLTAVGMVVDLARPLLDWTNPQKAIKQNLNVLLAMCAQVAILAALYFAVRVLLKAGLPDAAILVALYVVLAGLSVASYAALGRFAERRYPEIEG